MSMHTKIKIILSVAVLCALPLTSSANTNSTTTPATTNSPAVSEPLLITQIMQAKQLLEPVKLNYALTPHYKTTTQARSKTKKRVLTNYTLDIKDIALAVLDPTTGEIKITVAMQRGSDFEFPDKSMTIKKVLFNGVNSRFDVVNPDHYQVLALKYLITPTESGSKAQIENALYPAIYVPYSPELATPEVVAYGKDYMNGVIQKVSVALANVPSQSIPGKTIVEAIPPSIIKALAYAEHTSSANVQSLGSLNPMNVLLAGNGPDTYKYSVSNDGYFSRGIAQFIPSTYASLVTRHKELGFIPDFKAGMEDHVNSVKAMYVLLDDYAASIRKQAPQNFMESRVFEYGAAAYNGGVTRIAKALANYGDNWNSDRGGTIQNTQAQLNSVNAQIKQLTAKAKATKDKKAKAALTSQVATLKTQATGLQSQVDTLTAATLRNETMNYLRKIYSVIHLLNAESAGVQVAMN